MMLLWEKKCERKKGTDFCEKLGFVLLSSELSLLLCPLCCCFSWLPWGWTSELLQTSSVLGGGGGAPAKQAQNKGPVKGCLGTFCAQKAN